MGIHDQRLSFWGFGLLITGLILLTISYYNTPLLKFFPVYLGIFMAYMTPYGLLGYCLFIIGAVLLIKRIQHYFGMA